MDANGHGGRRKTGHFTDLGGGEVFQVKQHHLPVGRLQPVDGGEQTTYRANQVFYEPPGALHSVSANASSVNPARFLAIVVAEKGAPITVTP